MKTWKISAHFTDICGFAALEDVKNCSSFRWHVRLAEQKLVTNARLFTGFLSSKTWQISVRYTDICGMPSRKTSQISARFTDIYSFAEQEDVKHFHSFNQHLRVWCAGRREKFPLDSLTFTGLPRRKTWNICVNMHMYAAFCDSSAKSFGVTEKQFSSS